MSVVVAKEPFNNHPLVTCLQAAVPLWIADLQLRGGPTDDDWGEAQKSAQDIAEHGDILQFGSKKKGEAGRLFNVLAKALAVMAFCPGGVRFAGCHWIASVESRSARP